MPVAVNLPCVSTIKEDCLEAVRDTANAVIDSNLPVTELRTEPGLLPRLLYNDRPNIPTSRKP
jgi:hypothetical protein